LIVGVRLVLDQGVPRDTAALLRERGHQCIHVGEIEMSTSADEEIVAYALGREAIIITLDADFHALLAVSGASWPSVIRLRMQTFPSFSELRCANIAGLRSSSR
jgi:predicted nuclease of predicted toxin-antitoxin system